MLVAAAISDVRSAVAAARGRGLSIGLVPTMGALHEGHASLIRAARRNTGFVVVSIFVNPTQFGPKEDLSRYPRPFEADRALCEQLGVDLIFHPEPAVVYPADYHTYVEVHDLQDGLCGASRPGHFRGVATVVLKLFNIVQPDVAFFGQKDAQQARLLEQMVEDLNVPVKMSIRPIVREPDGLALSSRNVYLDADQRRHAVVLHRSLEEVQSRVNAGERDALKLSRVVADKVANTPGARLDYATAVDAKSLRPVDRLTGRVLFAMAVYFGSTRLIDNVILDVPA